VIELISIVLNGIGVYVVRLISIVLKIDGQVGGGGEKEKASVRTEGRCLDCANRAF
jgi:hypothetical protein